MIVRSVAVWAVFVALLVSVFYVFSRLYPAAPFAQNVGLLVLLTVVFSVTFGWGLMRGRAIMRLNNQGAAFMSQGRYAAALESFEQALSKAKSSAALHMNVGLANQHLWRLDASLQSLEAATGAAGAEMIRMLLLPELALTQALLGRIPQARATIEKARELNDNPGALLAEAVSLCREGSWDRALAVLERHEVRSLGGIQRGIADALRAWCVEHVTGAQREVDRTAVYGETGPDAVRPWWPEFVDFLEASAHRELIAASRRS